MKRLFSLTVLFLLGSSATAKAAPTAETKECIAAFDQGQHLRTDHHLKDAEKALLACTKEACPAVLRADCADVLKNVESAVPSIVLAAEDNGKDVTDVKVLNGTEVVASSLDAQAIELDPGTYDFRFERGTATPVWVHFVLREGEKNREVRGIFNPRKPPPPPSMVLVREPRSLVGYAVPGGFVGVSVAAFIFAAVTRHTFDNDVTEFSHVCAPNCTEASRAELSNTLVRANVALGVGIGSLVIAAATWFILAPGYRAATPTTAALTW